MSFYDKFNTLCHFVTNMHIVSLCDKHTLCFCAMNMHKNKVYVNGLIRPKESPNRQCDILQHYQVPPFQYQLCIGQPTKPLPLFSLQGQKTQTGHVSPPRTARDQNGPPQQPVHVPSLALHLKGVKPPHLNKLFGFLFAFCSFPLTCFYLSRYVQQALQTLATAACRLAVYRGRQGSSSSN